MEHSVKVHIRIRNFKVIWLSFSNKGSIPFRLKQMLSQHIQWINIEQVFIDSISNHNSTTTSTIYACSNKPYRECSILSKCDQKTKNHYPSEMSDLITNKLASASSSWMQDNYNMLMLKTAYQLDFFHFHLLYLYYQSMRNIRIKLNQIRMVRSVFVYDILVFTEPGFNENIANSELPKAMFYLSVLVSRALFMWAT